MYVGYGLPLCTKLYPGQWTYGVDYSRPTDVGLQFLCKACDCQAERGAMFCDPWRRLVAKVSSSKPKHRNPPDRTTGPWCSIDHLSGIWRLTGH